MFLPVFCLFLLYMFQKSFWKDFALRVFLTTKKLENLIKKVSWVNWFLNHMRWCICLTFWILKFPTHNCFSGRLKKAKIKQQQASQNKLSKNQKKNKEQSLDFQNTKEFDCVFLFFVSWAFFFREFLKDVIQESSKTFFGVEFWETKNGSYRWKYLLPKKKKRLLTNFWLLWLTNDRQFLASSLF